MTVELREPPAAEYEAPLPPQDVGAEMCVLGAMMLSADAIAAVTGVLSTRDFYRPAHQTIYDAIIDLYGRGEPVDARTVAAHIGTTQLGRVGGPVYLIDLIHTVPTAANGGYYAEIVAEKATLRRLVESGTRIAQLGYGTDASGGDVDEAVDRAQQEIYAVTNESAGDQVHSVTDLLSDAISEIEALAAGEVTPGLPTGYAALDDMLRMRDGQMLVLAARPSIGKSTAGLDIARHLAVKLALPALVFSMEMSRSEIMARLLSAEAKIDLKRLQNGKLGDDQWHRLNTAAATINGVPLHIDDTAGLTIADIRSKARRLSQQLAVNGQRLRLIVVDYLQLMTTTGRHDNRQEAVAAISRALKLLAKDLAVPVIAISQLNRQSEQRSDKTPMLSDLRESGAIENDADGVILIHRPDFYDPMDRPGEADFIVAKNRNGCTGTAQLAFQGHYSRFVDIAATGAA